MATPFLRYRASEPSLRQFGCDDKPKISSEAVIDTINHLEKLHVTEMDRRKGYIEEIQSELDAERTERERESTKMKNREKARRTDAIERARERDALITSLREKAQNNMSMTKERDAEIVSLREVLQNEKQNNEALRVHIEKTEKSINRTEQKIDDLNHQLKKGERHTTRMIKLNAELHEKNIMAAREKKELGQRWALKLKQATDTADYAQRVAGLALVEKVSCEPKTTSDLTSVNRSLIAVNNELIKRVKELKEENACLRENNTSLTEQNRTVLSEVQEYIRKLELKGLIRGEEDAEER